MVRKPVCDRTHRLVLEGACPWCECVIAIGGPNAASGGRTCPPLKWNLPILLDTLNHHDNQARFQVVSNLLLFGPRGIDTLPVLRKALCDPSAEVRGEAAQTLSKWGRELSADEAERWESYIGVDPQDFPIRIVLLGYYGIRECNDVLSIPGRAARQQHILWVIENAPRFANSVDFDTRLEPDKDGEAYRRCKQLWLRQAQDNERDVTILVNAADFLTHFDGIESERLLKIVRNLDPCNFEWCKRLGQLYRRRLRALPVSASRPIAKQALAAFEDALSIKLDDVIRFWMLPEIAQAACDAGEPDKARAYAVELLEKASEPGYFYWRNGNAVHYGNLVLGRLALHSGDIQAANAYLLEAGKTTGSPVLSTAGPNMLLAYELLRLGETQTVIQYLQLCSEFWQSPDHQAEKWAYEIQRGQIPDFGINLHL